jgi:hypothetical protein
MSACMFQAKITRLERLTGDLMLGSNSGWGGDDMFAAAFMVASNSPGSLGLSSRVRSKRTARVQGKRISSQRKAIYSICVVCDYFLLFLFPAHLPCSTKNLTVSRRSRVPMISVPLDARTGHALHHKWVVKHKYLVPTAKCQGMDCIEMLCAKHADCLLCMAQCSRQGTNVSKWMERQISNRESGGVGDVIST